MNVTSYFFRINPCRIPFDLKVELKSQEIIFTFDFVEASGDRVEDEKPFDFDFPLANRVSNKSEGKTTIVAVQTPYAQ